MVLVKIITVLRLWDPFAMVTITNTSLRFKIDYSNALKESIHLWLETGNKEWSPMLKSKLMLFTLTFSV